MAELSTTSLPHLRPSMYCPQPSELHCYCKQILPFNGYSTEPSIRPYLSSCHDNNMICLQSVKWDPMYPAQRRGGEEGEEGEEVEGT